MRAVSPRTFNITRIDEDNNLVIKTSLQRKLKTEYEWYKELPVELSEYVPDVISFSKSSDSEYCLILQRIPFEPLHFKLLDETEDLIDWVKIFQRIKNVHLNFEKYTTDCQVEESLKMMYVRKTLQRLQLLKRHSRFRLFFEHDFFVNGLRIHSLNYLIDHIQEIVISLGLLRTSKFTLIHGDLCLPNIIVTPDNNNVFLIDPRGTFGDVKMFGDARYDIAKLAHSVIGNYDLIIEDLYNLEVHGNSINYSMLHRPQSELAKAAFLRVFSDSNWREIYGIEALLFLSMIPLHDESFRQQIVMLATGVEILKNVME